MNNFNGQLSLYPEICIDNFSSNIIFQPKIRCFILTHFHDDHMKNLEDINFYHILLHNKDLVKFYCSSITKKFIQTCDKYTHLTDMCIEVPSESPFIVSLSSKETVTVSFCGSGHCPGSVMVFIEGSRGNVLFTGDFRLPINCASRLSFFKTDLNKQLKSVDNLYIDMTFFKLEVPCIPTREESTQKLITFIQNYIGESTNNYVYLKTSARIGYEYVYQEIYRITGYKVHVNDLIYKIYDQLPQIQSCLTIDPYETQIHSCIYELKRRDLNKKELIKSTSLKSFNYKNNDILIPCVLDLNNELKNDNNEFKLAKVNSIKIILSAMWFTDTAGVDQLFVEYKPTKKELNSVNYKPYKKIYRLCYSFHSSLEEIINFVNILKPKKLYSIALPESTNEDMINNYFYDSNGIFLGFKANQHQSNLNEKQHDFVSNNLNVNKNELFLRKRKFENNDLKLGIFTRNYSDSESSSESSSKNELDELNFCDSDEELNKEKKLKSH